MPIEGFNETTMFNVSSNNLFGIAVVQDTTDLASSPCLNNPCPGFCIEKQQNGSSYVCLCPTGKLCIFLYKLLAYLTVTYHYIGQKMSNVSGVPVCECINLDENGNCLIEDVSLPTTTPVATTDGPDSCNKGTQFSCTNSSQCIPIYWKCDGDEYVI